VGIYLYANINGKLAWYSTNKSILPKYWNEKKQEVKAICPDWININSHIKLYLTKANEYITQCNIEGIRANKQSLNVILRSVNYREHDYFSFVQEHIKNHSANYAPNTINGFKSHLNKLREFRNTVEFEDIDPIFWSNYETFLKEKGNKINTVHKQVRLFRKFLNKAVELGIIRENQLRDIKVRKEEGNRQFLTIGEVKKLQNYYDENKDSTRGEIKVLRCFLFACYTGLRYSDVKQLRFKDILDKDYIDFVQIKTGKSLKIPLNQKAKALLPEETLPNAPVFRLFTNQVSNRHLKKIMEEADIKKKISFHCARHTYATISLELSGNIAVVSKILGHASLKTTQIYAKVLENEKKKVMDKWDEI
jgi:integrase/recombinase XerC